MKRSYWGMILSMFAVFGSGIVVGAFGYHSYTVKTVKANPVKQEQPKPNPDDWRKNYVEELRTRLELDQKQLTGLNQILDETRDRFRSVRDRQKQEFDQMRTEIRAQQTDKIRAMLSSTQKTEYELIREERERKMKAEQAAREQAAREQAKAQTGKAGN